MTHIDAVIKAVVKLYPAVRGRLHGRARWICGASIAIDYAKTFDHYLRQITGLVNDLWDGEISESEFVDSMADIIPAQLTKAWREGMQENGLDPDEEMLPEWQDQLDAMILSEYDYVDGFASYVADTAKTEGATIDGPLARAELWAQRYTDVYNEAIVRTADGKTKYVWRLGDTEENCPQCRALDGLVAFAREWEESGFRPQQPPNSMLECGGWRCDCSLEETTDRRSSGALDRLLNIAQGSF